MVTFTGRGCVAVALLVVLAGCGGEGDLTPEAAPAATASSEPVTEPQVDPPVAVTPTSDPTPEPTTTSSAPPADAAAALDRGLVALLDSGVVDFRFTMKGGPSLFVETAGRAATAGGWSSSTNLSDEAAAGVSDSEVEDLRLEVRAPGRRDVFMQMAGWAPPFAGCWLEMGPDEVPVGLLAMTPGTPAYVAIMATVRATGFDPDDTDGSIITATVPLRGAMYLLTGATVQALDVPASGLRDRVPARVYLEKGLVTDVAVRGSDVVEAVRATGGDADNDYAVALAAIYLSVRYTPAPANAEVVTAPDPGSIMSADDMDADRGCGSSRARLRR